MGKAYSVDLRLRLLAALDEGMSQSQAHQTFRISRSTIDAWLCLREQTSSVEVRASRAGKKGLPTHAAFSGFVVRHQHSTLEQMSVAWREETQQSLSLMSFSRALRACGYTRKKRVIFTANDKKSKDRVSRSK